MARSDRDADYDEWMAGLTFEELHRRLAALGVEKVVLKRLADAQDNSKNQIYWEGKLNNNPLPLDPFVEFDSVYKGVAQKGYKASFDFEWLTPMGTNPAPHAQLIYYPRYPESRLGGLLRDADYAPRSVIGSRESAVPGRVMALGIAGRRVIGVALPPDSPAASHLRTLIGAGPFASWPLTPQAEAISAQALLAELRGVFDLSPVPACKLVRGQVVPSTDQNAPGMTLELAMGVGPNARDEPDFHGWELKSYNSSRITLMTPAPTGGSVVEDSPEEFMRRFGRLNAGGTRWDFTGAHTAIHVPGGLSTTRMVVTESEVQLVHRDASDVAMSWRVSDLLTHWAKKHANAAFVRRDGSSATGFTYGPFVTLGSGVDWTYVWQALANGTMMVDPAYNWVVGRRSMTKARAQFRCTSLQLPALYPSITGHDLRHVRPSRRLAHANLRAEGFTLPDWIELGP